MAILCVHNPSSLLVQGGAIWVGSGVNVLTISSSKIYSNIAGRGVSADPRETACNVPSPAEVPVRSPSKRFAVPGRDPYLWDKHGGYHLLEQHLLKHG